MVCKSEWGVCLSKRQWHAVRMTTVAVVLLLFHARIPFIILGQTGTPSTAGAEHPSAPKIPLGPGRGTSCSALKS